MPSGSPIKAARNNVVLVCQAMISLTWRRVRLSAFRIVIAPPAPGARKHGRGEGHEHGGGQDHCERERLVPHLGVVQNGSSQYPLDLIGGAGLASGVRGEYPLHDRPGRYTRVEVDRQGGR